MEPKLYGMGGPSLHHYPHHGFTGNYGLQRPSFTSMYTGSSLGYTPSDWSLRTGSMGMGVSGSFLRTDHHREYLSCAVASGSSGLPLGSSMTHGNHYPTSVAMPYPTMPSAGLYSSPYNKDFLMPSHGGLEIDTSVQKDSGDLGSPDSADCATGEHNSCQHDSVTESGWWRHDMERFST